MLARARKVRLQLDWRRLQTAGRNRCAVADDVEDGLAFAASDDVELGHSCCNMVERQDQVDQIVVADHWLGSCRSTRQSRQRRSQG